MNIFKPEDFAHITRDLLTNKQAAELANKRFKEILKNAPSIYLHIKSTGFRGSDKYNPKRHNFQGRIINLELIKEYL